MYIHLTVPYESACKPDLTPVLHAMPVMLSGYPSSQNIAECLFGTLKASFLFLVSYFTL